MWFCLLTLHSLTGDDTTDGVELMFVGIGFICVPIAMILYTRINKKRAELQQRALENGEENKYTVQQLREMGDRAPDFKYTI